MDNWTIALIIVLVLGVIASNITLLKYSAKFKFPSELKQQRPAENKKSSFEEE